MSVHTAIRRGEVFFADLHGGVGYEQNGERPVVVLQNDMGNRYSPTVIVAPLTSSRTKKPLPTHVWCGADSGMTPMGEAINLGLDLLERRKEQFRSVGVDYFQPWFVLMSDGAPNGAADHLARAKQRMDSLARDKKLSVFPIGIGAHADMKALAEFSPMRSPLKLKGLKFREFFEWLSQSVSTTSQSIAGESISLDFEGIKGWAEL